MAKMSMNGEIRPRRKRKKRKKFKKLLFICLVVCLAVAVCRTSGVANYLQAFGSENPDGSEWNLVLVNKRHPLDIDEDKIEFTELANGERVDKRMYPHLQEMFDAARRDGVYLKVNSGYRSFEEQQRIYDEKIYAYKVEGLSGREASKAARQWVNLPGTSEHQLGLAVDITADEHSDRNAVYQWLQDNAHRYGFIKRYPSDKTDITGVANEPWHYRYVGEKAAAEIHSRGICLEEYLNE